MMTNDIKIKHKDLYKISKKFYHKIHFITIIKIDRAQKITFDSYNYRGSFVQAFEKIKRDKSLFFYFLTFYESF